MRKIILTLALVLAIPTSAQAGFSSSSSGSRSGGSSFSSGGSKSSGGGGSKSYSSGGGSKSSGGGGGSKSYSSPKAPTASKPSSGPVAQKAPVSKLIPPKPPATLTKPTLGGAPPRVRIPAGHDYARDSRALRGQYSYRGSRYYYGDPYGPSYFGSYNSPFFYIWLGTIMDNDPSNDALPPERKGKVSDALESYLGVIEQEAEFMASKK